MAPTQKRKAPDVVPEFSPEWLVETWNAIAVEIHQGPLEKNGQRLLQSRINEDPARATKAWWREYIQRIGRKNVMNGNDSYYLPLLSALTADKMEKVLSGYYGLTREES